MQYVKASKCFCWFTYVLHTDLRCAKDSLYQENLVLGEYDVCLSNVDSLYLFTNDKKRKLLPGQRVPDKVKTLYVLCKVSSYYIFVIYFILMRIRIIFCGTLFRRIWKCWLLALNFHLWDMEKRWLQLYCIMPFLNDINFCLLTITGS